MFATTSVFDLCVKETLVTDKSRWQVHLITPNHKQAKACYDSLIAKGYHSHFKKGGNLVEIKKAGPSQCLFFVRTKYKEPK